MARSNKKKSPSKKGKQKAARHPAAGAMLDFIYIRIPISLLLPINAPGTSADPLPADPMAHLYLIEGSYEAIQRYAGTTADWLIKVAHLICDPLGNGQVYTHTTGTPEYWRLRDRTDTWREVVPGDPLLPGIYELHTTGPVTLSKISERHTQSRVSEGSTSNASTFNARIMRRDGSKCVVSHSPTPLTATHLIPKRLGASGAIEVVTRFSGEQVALGIDVFDPRIGIMLIDSLNRDLDLYQLGFYHVTGDNYTLHNFNTDYPDLTTLGVPQSANPGGLPLHLHSTTLLDHDGSGTLPHPGIFNSHYLQCVLRAFGTMQYKNFGGIAFFVYPFKTDSDSDDSDDKYTDIDEIDPDNPPWPSYNFDKFLREQGKKRLARERHEAVVKWSSEVASSN